jgi:hypothetical protein
VNSATQGEATPEFVRWTIAQPCPLREESNWRDPEQTERLLRPVREVGEARRQGRAFQGVVFQDAPAMRKPLDAICGFIIEQSLAYFGGEERVASQCDGCPANALARDRSSSLAGCYGMFYLADAELILSQVERLVACRSDNLEPTARFEKTQPAWYGLWISTPWCNAQIQELLAIFDAVFAETPHAAPGLGQFLLGLRVSQEVGLPMYARLLPAGTRLPHAWKIGSHCKKCKAARPLRDPECKVCGLRGDVCEGRTRKVHGSRPHYPLVRQLGAAQVQALTEAYWAPQKHQEPNIPRKAE